MQRFHERLSDATIYLRFFGSIKESSEEKAQYFAHVNGEDQLAFVALDPEGIIAGVRYYSEPIAEKAEYAALVENR